MLAMYYIHAGSMFAFEDMVACTTASLTCYSHSTCRCIFVHRQLLAECMWATYEVFMLQWAEPWRHGIVIVCVCMCNSVPLISQRALKQVLKIALHAQCDILLPLIWLLLMSDLLTLTTVYTNAESIKDQPASSNLLDNMTVASVQQIRWQPKRNPENETAKATLLNYSYS